jgi:hypothetical protein
VNTIITILLRLLTKEDSTLFNQHRYLVFISKYSKHSKNLHFYNTLILTPFLTNIPYHPSTVSKCKVTIISKKNKYFAQNIFANDSKNKYYFNIIHFPTNVTSMKTNPLFHIKLMIMNRLNILNYQHK